MNLTDMTTMIRGDLKDQAAPYLWSDEELARHLERALKELSASLPLPVKAVLPTTAGAREIDIASLSDRVMVQAVEYPLGQFPPAYQRFSLWGESLSITTGLEPDGTDCAIYYGRLHAIDPEGSTLPAKYEDLVATGAAGYAAISLASYAINRVNTGGKLTSQEYRAWGNERLVIFRERLRRLGSKNRVRNHELFKE